MAELIGRGVLNAPHDAVDLIERKNACSEREQELLGGREHDLLVYSRVQRQLDQEGCDFSADALAMFLPGPKLTKKIAVGTNPEMLGQATENLRILKQQGATADDLASAFESMAQEIESLSGGAWSASRAPAGGGSHIFAGGRGHALVISPDGKIFRGNILTPGQFEMREGVFYPVYEALSER